VSLTPRNYFSGVNDTSETVSAVSMTPLKFGKKNFWWLKRYFSFHDHGGFSGVIDTAETVSAVALTPRKQFPQCQ
jgi:hypothetical protein